MNTKKEYIAPKLTEFSYRSEDGFALSIMNNPLNHPNPLFDDCSQERWVHDDHFGNSDWEWE